MTFKLKFVMKVADQLDTAERIALYGSCLKGQSIDGRQATGRLKILG